MSRVLCAVLLVVCCVISSSSYNINDTIEYSNEITYRVNEDGSMTAIILCE